MSKRALRVTIITNTADLRNSLVGAVYVSDFISEQEREHGVG